MSRTRTSPCSPAGCPAATGSWVISSGRPSVPSSRSTFPRPRDSRRPWQSDYGRRRRCSSAAGTRGERDAPRRILSLFSSIEDSTDLQDQSCWRGANASLRLAEGRLEEALAAGLSTIETAATLGPNFQSVKQGVVDALEAALGLGD